MAGQFRRQQRTARRERIARVTLAMSEGASIAEIAASEGVTSRRLLRILRQVGVYNPNRSGHIALTVRVLRRHLAALDDMAGAMGQPRAKVLGDLLAAALADNGAIARRTFGKLLPKRVES